MYSSPHQLYVHSSEVQINGDMYRYTSLYSIFQAHRTAYRQLYAYEAYLFLHKQNPTVCITVSDPSKCMDLTLNTAYLPEWHMPEQVTCPPDHKHACPCPHIPFTSGAFIVGTDGRNAISHAITVVLCLTPTPGQAGNLFCLLILWVSLLEFPRHILQPFCRILYLFLTHL